MFDLTGKVALVTGATGGIGAAIAEALHRQGAAIALTGRREAELALSIRQHDPLGAALEDSHDLPDTQTFRENLGVRQGRLVFEVRNPPVSIGRPCGHWCVVGGRNRSVAPGNRVAMWVATRMAQRRRQRLHLIGRERVFLALGRGVYVAQRQPRLVREIALEQPMSPDDLTRHTFAFSGQLKLLTGSDHQALLLHASKQLHESLVFDPQHSAERRKRSMTPAILQIEKMFQCILDLCAPTDVATPTDMADEDNKGARENHRRQHD